MEPVVSQTDATKGNATAQPVKFELRELFWANHPSAPKDLPKAHFAWAITGDDLYLSPVYNERYARLLVAAPQLLQALTDLLWMVENANPEQAAWDFPTRARAAIAKATTV